MKKIIIMIGPPGSGKGTQAKLIAKKYNYIHISTGDLLRSLANKKDKSKKEQEALDLISKGNLASDEMIFELTFNKILESLKKNPGVILDGAIRTIEQANGFQKFFVDNELSDEVVALEVALTDEESFKRLTTRRMCSSCGEIIPWTSITKDLRKCPKCGGELQIRRDDRPEVINERIQKQGNKAIKPLLDFYNKLGVLKNVDGNQTIEKVEEEIGQALMSEKYAY